MALPQPSYQLPHLRSPRTRGDGPTLLAKCLTPKQFSPHARGWPGAARFAALDLTGSPRTRGDGPKGVGATAALTVRSPRTRGDGPLTRQPDDDSLPVLPARAGMARGAGFMS